MTLVHVTAESSKASSRGPLVWALICLCLAFLRRRGRMVVDIRIPAAVNLSQAQRTWIHCKGSGRFPNTAQVKALRPFLTWPYYPQYWPYGVVVHMPETTWLFYTGAGLGWSIKKVASRLQALPSQNKNPTGSN